MVKGKITWKGRNRRGNRVVLVSKKGVKKDKYTFYRTKSGKTHCLHTTQKVLRGKSMRNILRF